MDQVSFQGSEFLHEIGDIMHSGANGIGLFRTEGVFLEKDRLPDEEEQYQAYRRLSEELNNMPVVLRTLDAGGDKIIKDLENPSITYNFLDVNDDVEIKNRFNYLIKERKEEALKFYEKGVVDDQDNYSLVKNTLLLQIDFKKYEAAEELSAIALEIFPSQPLLYLLNGVANNGLKRTDIAIESLETGLDYLLEDQKMELDFYEQLVVAYTERGDIKSAEGFRNKAKQIKGSN